MMGGSCLKNPQSKGTVLFKAEGGGGANPVETDKQHRNNYSKLCTFFHFESDKFCALDFRFSVFTHSNSTRCVLLQTTHDYKH